MKNIQVFYLEAMYLRNYLQKIKAKLCNMFMSKDKENAKEILALLTNKSKTSTDSYIKYLFKIDEKFKISDESLTKLKKILSIDFNILFSNIQLQNDNEYFRVGAKINLEQATELMRINKLLFEKHACYYSFELTSLSKLNFVSQIVYNNSFEEYRIIESESIHHAHYWNMKMLKQKQEQK